MPKSPEPKLLPRIAIPHLTDTDGILAELRNLYRAARRGELEAADATKLTYILKVMSEVMTLRDLESRLDSLESGKPYLPRTKEKAREHEADRAAH